MEPFAQEVDYWERILSTIGEVLEIMLVVQREYAYLDNIFTTEDIRKQLPKETDDFDRMTSEWTEHTSRMASHGLALPATHDPRTCYQRTVTKGIFKRKIKAHDGCVLLCAQASGNPTSSAV